MALFGTLPNTSAQLAARLVSTISLKQMDERLSRVWTDAVKSALREMGYECGFDVFPSSAPQHGEYLLDLVWFSETGGFELAAECEWQHLPKVLADFKKLVYVKAPLKVMIYWLQSPAKNDENFRRAMIRYLEQYSRHVAGEEYLFIGFGKGGDNRCYSYLVPRMDATNQSCFRPFQ
jgi:hypothetical protein